MNKNIFGSQNKYLLLFDFINNNTSIDEISLKLYIKEHDLQKKK